MCLLRVLSFNLHLAPNTSINEFYRFIGSSAIAAEYIRSISVVYRFTKKCFCCSQVFLLTAMNLEVCLKLGRFVSIILYAGIFSQGL